MQITSWASRANRRAGDNGSAGSNTDATAAPLAAPAAAAAHSAATSFAAEVITVLEIKCLLCTMIIKKISK